MLLSIVTLNYKTPELTLACVQSVYEQYKKEFEKGEIEHIIVDNASQDGSVEKISTEIKKYKNVHLIANTENVGFGNGCNKGTESAKGSYILFLNSDTSIADNGLLHMALFLEKHPEVAILGGQMKNLDGSLQLSAWKFYTLPNLLILLLGGERFGFLRYEPKIIEKVDWVTGGCMMVDASKFKKIGMFDKHIFMYMEDMELCFRAKKAGYATYFYPQVTIFHKSQGSSNRSFAIINIYKGIRYFYKKYMPKWQYEVADFLLTCKAQILVIIGRVTSNSYLVETYEKTFTVS